MSNQSEYQRKLTTPEEAVQLIESGSNLAKGMAISEPPALMLALAERAARRDIQELNVFYMHSERHARASILRFELMDVIKPHCLGIGPIERELIKRAKAEGRQVIQYIPASFSEVPRFLTEYNQMDSFIATVAPMDKAGYFSLGLNNDYGSTVAKNCKHLILEVNENMPQVFGQSQIHISEVAALVENHVPLLEKPPRTIKSEDEAIGRQIVDMIPNGATIQTGAGGIPHVIYGFLENHRDLGIHSELFTSGMDILIEKGVVTNARKKIHPGKTIFTVAYGNQRLYDFMNHNPSLESYPVSYVNSAAVISQLDNLISVNTALQVDLLGQCNAEFLDGAQFSSPGGQLDFIRGAYNSSRGKSIIAINSTASSGLASRIVPQLTGPVTDSRIDTQIVVTEYGAVDLKGKTVSQRARGLINISHPRFRDELTFAAHKLDLI
jgi:itaconate CoA-transferase